MARATTPVKGFKCCEVMLVMLVSACAMRRSREETHGSCSMLATNRLLELDSLLYMMFAWLLTIC